MKKVICFFSLMLAVISCRSVHEPIAGRFFIVNNIESGLIPVNEFKSDVQMVQLLTSDYDGAEHTVDSIVKMNKDEMLVIGMADATRLFTIKYDSFGIDSSFSPLMGLKKVRPEYIIADIQMIYYPLKAIQKSLPSGMSIVEVQNKKSLKREIFYGGKKIMQIKYADKNIFKTDVEFNNLERKYSYKIRSNNE